MKKNIRKYLTWAVLGAIAGPLLWIAFAAFHVFQIQGLATFGDVFRELIDHASKGGEIDILIKLGMPTGAILFVVTRFLVSLFFSTISRLRFRIKNGRASGPPEAESGCADGNNSNQFLMTAHTVANA